MQVIEMTLIYAAHLLSYQITTSNIVFHGIMISPVYRGTWLLFQTLLDKSSIGPFENYVGCYCINWVGLNGSLLVFGIAQECWIDSVGRSWIRLNRHFFTRGGGGRKVVALISIVENFGEI